MHPCRCFPRLSIFIATPQLWGRWHAFPVVAMQAERDFPVFTGHGWVEQDPQLCLEYEACRRRRKGVHTVLWSGKLLRLTFSMWVQTTAHTRATRPPTSRGGLTRK